LHVFLILHLDNFFYGTRNEEKRFLVFSGTYIRDPE